MAKYGSLGRRGRFALNILEKNNFEIEYEPSLLLRFGRNWTPYPEFPDWSINKTLSSPTLYLPKQYTIIDFFEQSDYIREHSFSGENKLSRVDIFSKVYRDNELNFIPIPPLEVGPPSNTIPTLARNQYENHIMNSIDNFLEERLLSFRKLTQK